MFSEDLAISAAMRGRICRISLTGDLTATSGKRLSKTALDALQDGATGIELDLAGIKFIDSSGLQCLIGCRSAAADDSGASMTVVATSRLVQRVLEVTGLAVLLQDGTDLA